MLIVGEGSIQAVPIRIPHTTGPVKCFVLQHPSSLNAIRYLNLTAFSVYILSCTALISVPVLDIFHAYYYVLEGDPAAITHLRAGQS